MNPNGNVQEAEIVEKTHSEKTVPHKDTLALETLKTKISSARDNFKQQLADLKKTAEARENALKDDLIKIRKLEGAVEAAELFLK